MDHPSLLLELPCSQSCSMEENRAATTGSTFIFQLTQGTEINKVQQEH